MKLYVVNKPRSGRPPTPTKRGYPNRKNDGRNTKGEIKRELALVDTMVLPQNFHEKHDVREDDYGFKCYSCHERLYHWVG